MLTEVPRFFQTVWTDFSIKDQTIYDTKIDIGDVSYSDNVRDVALNFHRYNAYNKSGYGESTFDRGVTEQEAYDNWIQTFNVQNRIVLKALIAVGVLKISQNVYDAFVLLNWTTGKTLTVQASEGIYDLKPALLDDDTTTLANMINRSTINKQKCNRVANILRLVDYGKPKNRSWLRTNGIYEMRTKNELGELTSDQLRAARFAYYAETLDFLPFTPEGIKRDIASKYKETLIQQTFTYDGNNNTFELFQTPSMMPVEKLSVYVNNEFIQHYYDYTLSGQVLTITKTININDIIKTTIKI